MATAILHSLPQAPHELWQTAASPFILPSRWQSMYKQCPRCGGNAPNVCDDVWPERWWEDDMLGLMYQGHIPPAQRTAPWEAYYADARLQYLAALVQQQTPLRLNIGHKHHSHPQAAHYPVPAPMTPPMTPGSGQHIPHYSMAMPSTPESPTMQYHRQGTPDSFASYETPHPAPLRPYNSANDYSPYETPRQRLARHLRRLFFS